MISDDPKDKEPVEPVAGSYYERNKERVKARRRARYAENAEQERAYQRAVFQADREGYLERKREWYHRNKAKKQAAE